MKIQNLLIERKPQYDAEYPNMLVGLVQLQGQNGKMEVKLSNSTISEIFSLIKQDLQRVAKQNASQVTHAIEEAENEGRLEHIEEVDLDDEVL